MSYLHLIYETSNCFFVVQALAILKEELPRYLSDVKSKRQENAKAFAFSSFIQRAFDIKSEEIDLEVPIKAEALKMRGRVDAVFGNLIIEFKKDLSTGLEDAEKELLKYFQAYHEKYPGVRYIGIANDGINFQVYQPVLEKSVVTKVERIDEINLEKASVEDVFLWFDSYFFVSSKIIPTSTDIRKRFGIDSPTYHSFTNQLADLFSQIGSLNQVKVKHTNWQRYLEIVYGDKPSGTKLFINHTYLATLAKILVHYRISGGKPVPKEEIKKIIFGDTFRKFGILNFIEDDFFTWFFQRSIYDISIDLVFRLAKELQIYDLDALDEDVLKELYQELVGEEVRHALGEYYTPDWLAERIVQELVNTKPTGSFLDPSCGSGTFLFSAIKMVIPALKKKGYSDDKILSQILENIVGVDINPLAVVIARTNYLLALKDVIKSRKGAVRIPVYLSDSIKFPELGLSLESAIPHYKMKAEDKLFEIPQGLAQRPALMDTIIEKMNDHARNYQDILEAAVKKTGDSEKLRNGLLDSFERSLQEVSDQALKRILIANLRTMTELIDSGNDSIWAYILKNILRPISFMNKKFHFIIGNPPWLAMQFMMNPDYQDFLKKETFAYGLIDKRQTHLFTHMEMATLFFCKISDIYLEDGGTIAFVMPKSVLTALHHSNFIKFRFEEVKEKNLSLKLEKVINTEEVRPLFNIPSCTLFAKKGHSTVYPVPMLKMEGTLSSRNEKWIDAKNSIKITETFFSPVSVKSDDRSPYYNLFFQGATMFPRNFWFVTLQSDSLLGFNSEVPAVASDRDNDTKEPWKKVFLEGNVEADALYATVIGKDIVPFGYKKLRPIVMPLLPRDKKLVLMKSHNDAHENNLRKLAEYLSLAEKAWKENAQKDSNGKLKIESPYIRLDYPQRNLTRQNPIGKFKVLYVAAATFLTSCVISPKDPLVTYVEGKKVNLRAFLAESKTYFFETEDELEAHYLCAILNSKLVDDWIKPLQNTGQWGERDIHKRPLMLPIPTFDAANAIHSRIALLGKKCREKVLTNMGTINSKSIGRDRSKVRELLLEEMAEINSLASKIVPIPKS